MIGDRPEHALSCFNVDLHATSEEGLRAHRLSDDVCIRDCRTCAAFAVACWARICASRKRSDPAHAALINPIDGFTGWLVLGWTLLLTLAAWHWRERFASLRMAN